MKTSISRTGWIGTNRGFTILEFLIVICIAGIVSTSLALWMGEAFNRQVVSTKASQIEAELWRTADLARRTGHDQVVYFRQSPSSSDLMFGQKVIKVIQPVTAEWTAAAEAGSSAEFGTIIFFSTGGSSGGTLTLSQGRSRTEVTIDWLTARITEAKL